MKCEIAKDLMPLYAEQLCSEKTSEALEEHLKNCPDCAQQMERYRNALETEHAKQKDKNTAENAKGLQPMKKVKKKLWYRKYIILLLVFLLLATVGGIGMLTYGEMTNSVPGFSTIADAVKLKKVCEKLTKGDTEAFMEILPFTFEEEYAIRGAISLENMEQYRESVQKTMEAAYEYHFKGREIEVKIGEINQYSYDQVNYVNETPTVYVIDFYEQREKIYSMEFSEIAMGKYMIYEDGDVEEPQFVAQMLPYDDIQLDIWLTYATRNQYQKLLNGEEVSHIGGALALVIKEEGTEEQQTAYKEQIYQGMQQLCHAGWYLKETMHAVETYDATAGKWIYKVWLMLENQEDGTICICEYRFYYSDDNLYVINEEEKGKILSGDEDIPVEIKELITNLF